MSDVIVVAVYLLAVTVIGFFFRDSNHDKNDYFLAGRSVHWIPVGISIMVTAFSTLNFVAVTAEVFSFGLYVLLAIPMFFLVYFPVSRIFLPTYRKLNVTSAYELLEHKFDRKVRVAGSSMFIVWKMIWMAVSLYAAGTALSAVSGFPVYWVIIIAGVVSLVYTANGGIKAVIVTDTLQFAVLFGGVITVLLVAFSRFDYSFSQFFDSALSVKAVLPFSPFDSNILSPSWNVRISVWSTLLGVFVAFSARYGVDQVVVQRYFTARSSKDVRKSFILNAFSAVLVILLIAAFGIFVKIYAVENDLHLKPLKAVAVFLNTMPAGVSGMLVAGLMAAMMSSIDSGINSCATAFFTDIYKKDFSIRKARIVSAVTGILVIILALPVGNLGSLFVTVNKVVNGMGAPLLALFIFAIFSKIRAKAALKGFISGIVASILVIVFLEGISLHYYAVINFVLTSFFIFIFSLTQFSKSATQ